MNLILTLLATIASAVTTSSQLLPTRRLTHRADREVPKLPALRLCASDSERSSTANELVTSSPGYATEGVAAGIFPTQVGQSTLFFRLYNDGLGHHAYTINTTEVQAFLAAGYVLETTPGYVYAAGICGSVPLYRMLLASRNDYFYTTSAGERNTAISEGYTDQGIAAYVQVPGIIGGDTVC
ncbi:hypothetical protein B0H14DRAFT_2820269 [Mycena olivaceomarginata]|nr:hypothetical protein B0H14DRAFT_2820269 [Mycena olivaceomarginata]